MKKITTIFIIFVILLAQSYITAEQSIEAERLEYMEEINKKEAINLARQYLIDKGLDKDYYVNKIVKVEEGDWGEEKNFWIVYVKVKKSFNGNRILTVEKSTGKVTDRGRTKW